MENVNQELCTLFVLRAASEPRFGKLVDRTLSGSLFNSVDLEKADFLPWETIVNRAGSAPYRAIIKLARLVKMRASEQCEAALYSLGKNAVLNKGRLSRFALEATLTDELSTDSDGSIVRRRLHLSRSAMPSEKSDFINLCRLVDWLEETPGKNKHVDELLFTPSAVSFFSSL